MIVNCTKSYIVSLHAYLIQLTNYMYSNLCDVVVVWVLSSGFCSNWTSRTDHGNLHWSRNDLIVEGIQSHCPIALYIVYVYQMYAEARRSYRIEFPLYLMLLNSIIGVRLTQYLASCSHQIKMVRLLLRAYQQIGGSGNMLSNPPPPQKFTGYEIAFEIISGEYWCFSEARRRFTFMINFIRQLCRTPLVSAFRPFAKLASHTLCLWGLRDWSEIFAVSEYETAR